MAYRSLRIVHRLPSLYFESLPSLNASDLDRDGIPDYIDDSDGDGIADKIDAEPYGKGVSILNHMKRYDLPPS